jgi:hypothetical protein
MLIDLPYKNGDTITIKTTSGEEIVARLEEENDKILKLHKPRAIMASGQGVGLGPFAFTVNPDADVQINKNTVVMIAKTDKEMASQYVQSTTGIAV